MPLLCPKPTYQDNQRLVERLSARAVVACILVKRFSPLLFDALSRPALHSSFVNERL